MGKMVKKTYVLSTDDMVTIKAIKEKALDKRLVLNDSYIIRLGLILLSQLPANGLVALAATLPKSPMGRPKTGPAQKDI